MRQVECLNRLLQVWEDMCYIAKTGGTAQIRLGRQSRLPLLGPLVHFAELRKHLLSAQTESFDAHRFLGNLQCFVNHFGVHYTLPHALYSWNRESRRVFTLEEDLQLMLDATRLDRVRWKDVTLPFKSFLVALRRPIQGETHSFDSILVHTATDQGIPGKQLQFRLLPTNFDEYAPVSTHTKREITRAFDRLSWKKALDLVDAAYEKLQRERRKCSVSSFFVDLEIEDALVTDSILKLARQSNASYSLPDHDFQEWGEAARLVVGMCMYFQTLPPQSTEKSEWRKLPRTESPDRKAITNEALLCTVSSSYKFNREEREALGLDQGDSKRRITSIELRAHFRMGHWRRAPGAGSDPHAPKSVHVRPTLVRRDRLKEGELPGGSETVL